MPGLIDCHVHAMLSEGELPLPRVHPADHDDGARRKSRARNDRSRFHDGARHRRRGLGPARRRCPGLPARPAHVHCRSRDRAYRRTLRLAATHRHRNRRVQVLQRDAVLPGKSSMAPTPCVRRCANSFARVPTRSRSWSPAGSPARTIRSTAASLPRGNRRRRRGGGRLRTLHAGPRVYAGRDNPRGQPRRAHR